MNGSSLYLEYIDLGFTSCNKRKNVRLGFRSHLFAVDLFQVVHPIRYSKFNRDLTNFNI